MSLKIGLRNRIRRSRAGGFTGLLDQSFATGATAAYSLRRLKASATKAVRVREDSGNTEIDIGFSGGTLDETALLAHCGSNNGFVTKWYDQSGNGNDASNSTASEQPQIVSGGSVIKENGKPAIDFDGTDDILTISTSTNQFLPLNFTAFLIASQVNTNLNFGELIGTSEELLYGFLDGGRDVAIFTEDTQGSNTPVKSNTLSSDNKQHWRYYERNSNELFVQIDKEPVATNNNAPTSNTLLKTDLSLNVFQNKDCKLQEFIYFDKSGVDKNKVRNNQNNFYQFPTF